MKPLQAFLVTLILLLASGTLGTIPVRSMSLSQRPHWATAEPSRVQLNVSITATGSGVAGMVTLSILSGKVTKHRAVSAPHRRFLLPSGATVQLSERAIDPAIWTFASWTILPRGRPAYSSTRQTLRLRLLRPVTVRLRFIAVPRVTPTPVAGTSSAATPSAMDTPAPVVPPSPTATIEPICRSWHPIPQCRFPTPTPAP